MRFSLILLALLLVVGMVVGTVSGATISMNASRYGHVAEASDAVFTVIIADTGDNADNTGTVLHGYTQAATTSPLMTIDKRAILTFPTDTLDDSAVITSAIVGIYPTNKYQNIGTVSLELIDATPQNAGGVYVEADFQKTTYNPLAANISYANVNTNKWNNIPLTNLSVINKTGNTTVMLTHSAVVYRGNLSESWASGAVSGYIYSSVSYRPNITITYYVAPTAAFSGTPTYGIAPYTVTFTDATDDPVSWLWDFGDGTTSTSQNPTHTYQSPGNYTVTLTATNPAGSDAEIKTDYIKVAAATPACPINLMTMYNVTGDGSNESTELQAAFDYARTQGTCTINFPQDKTIRFGSSLNMSEHLNLNGQNATLKIVDNYAGGTTGMIYTRDYDWWHELNYDGNSASLLDTQDYGIYIDDWVVMENSSFRNGTAYMLEAFHTSNWVFKNNYLENSTQYGIATGGATGWSENATVTGNTIRGMREVGIKIRGTANSTISNNLIYIPTYVSVDSDGIRFYTADRIDNNVIVEYNHIEGETAETGDVNVGIVSDDGSTGNSIIRHNVVNNTQFPYYIRGNGLTLLNNTATNTGRSVNIYGNYTNVTGNYFDRGISIGSGSSWHTSHNVFRSNVISGGIYYSDALYGVGDGVFFWAGTADNNTFDFNRITVSRYGFNINSSFGVVNSTQITNNVITAGGACYLDLGNDTYYYNNTCNAAMDPVIVSFTGIQTIPEVGKKQVVFTDTSTGSTVLSWIWNYTNVTGNNIPTTFSTEQNPTITFPVGNYSIVLNASAAVESNITADNTYFVNVSASDSSSVPIAAFSANATTVCYGATVTFTDTSTNTSSWAWTFGDGATSTEQNPEHTYNISSGYFTVALTASNGIGSDTETKTNYIEVQASCSGGDTTPSTHPFSAATGSSMITTALGILGLALIGFGVAIVVGALSSQSTDGLVAGIFTIMLGGAILIISYMFLSPIMNLVA